MITEEQWDRAFELLLPTVSLGVATLSVVLGIMALRRAGSLGRRTYSQDGSYLVSVRYPWQWNDIREFVQPDNPDVLAIYYQIGPDPWLLYDFVCREIDYRRDIRGEFWLTPSETLALAKADCEDTSILLCSLLRNFTDAHVAIGEYQGYGHAWVAKGGQIYETTYTRAMPASDPEHYFPYCLFDEREVIELWTGAFGEIFALRRNEVAKLNLMAEVLNGFA